MNYLKNDSKSMNLLTSDTHDNDEDFLSHLKTTYYFDDTTYVNDFKNCTKDFKILSMNCGGLRSKFDELSARLNYYKSLGLTFEAICLQETGLDSFMNVLPFQLADYNLIFQTKSASTKGGLIIYLSTDFSYKRFELPHFTNSIWEFMCIEICHSSSKKSQIICNIYRPPHNSVEHTDIFLEELQVVLAKLSNSTEIALFGDFNIDLLKLDESPLVKRFTDTIFSLFFFATNHITNPIYIS